MRTRRHSSRRGFALVLVLIIVSFAAAIAVLFLLSAHEERSGTNSYAEGSRVRQLSDTAVNIIMGQINDATREGTAAVPISWASQPGMIRTYKGDGTLSNAYKLYSWNSMIEAGASPFDPTSTSELPPATWTTQVAQYTDLNKPVNGVYPIMDPTIANVSTGGVATQSASAPKWDFPGEVAYATDQGGYHPSSGNALPMPVQWLYVLQDGTWVYPTNSTGATANFDAGVVTSANPIVGRIAFWTDDETCKVNVNTAAEGAYWDWPKAASQDEMQFAANPPAKNEFYRISGHPATTSLSAIFPELMAGGFSRWNAAFTSPNGPYLTGLQEILGQGTQGLNPRITFGSGLITGSQGGTFPAWYNQTYVPAYSGYGNGKNYATPNAYSPIVLPTGRLYATPDELWFQPNHAAGSTAAFADYGLTAQQLSQRLSLLTANSRAPETTLFNTPRISVWPITWPYPSSYYTADTPTGGVAYRGAAPSLASLIYPDSNTLSDLASYTFPTSGNHAITPQEDLIAFSSTLNSQSTQTTGDYAPLPYYFQRQNPDSPTNDWANIKRNRYLANYVRGLMHQNIPGFGASLESHWTAANTDWITLECLDYCRSMINQSTYDPSSSTGNLLYSFTGVAGRQFTFKTTTTRTTLDVMERNAYSAAPLRITPGAAADLGASNYFNGAPLANSTVNPAAYVTQGSYPSLKEAGIIFYATNRNMPQYVGPTTPVATFNKYVADPFYWKNLINPGLSGCPAGTASIPDGSPTGVSASIEAANAYPIGSQTTQIQAIMMFDFAQLRNGVNVVVSPNFWIRVDGADGLKISGTSASAMAASPTASVPYHARVGLGSNMPSTTITPLTNSTGSKTFDQTKPGSQLNWSLSSLPVTVNPSSISFGFTGAKVKVSIYADYPTDGTHTPDTDPTSDPNQFVTSYQLDFTTWSNPAMAMPIAPRWNQRQGQQVWYPNPFNTTTSGWAATEMVPDIKTIANWTWSGTSPTFDISDTEIRDMPLKAYVSPVSPPDPNATMSIDGLNTAASSGLQWMMYACSYDSPTPISPNALGTGTFPRWSLNMSNRLISASVHAAEGTPLPTGTGTALVSDTGSPLFTSTNFINGSGVVTYPTEATQVITPYDDVISVLVDPKDGTRQGDPRLANNAGEVVKFDTSKNVLGPLTATALPAMVLNGETISATSAVATTGKTAFPRPTYQTQYHQFGTPASTGMMTGYHLNPIWSKTSSPRGLGHLLGMEGVSIGVAALGSQQSMSGGVGLDTNAFMQLNPDWDWTSQPGNSPDGGYIERPDQNYQTFYQDPTATSSGMETPYFGRQGISNSSSGGNSIVSMFSPNRQVPSPIVFGTLPSSMTTGWQTLSFSPNPAIQMDGGSHPGVGTAALPSAVSPPYDTSKIPDHLLLDLFWMPAAEPYPISESFSTAGKVNLNYAMMPFPYIQRKSAIDAVLKSVWIYALADSNTVPQDYKSWYFMASSNAHAGNKAIHTRFPINVDATLKAFDYKFQKGDIFRSASQICDMFLYPNDPATANTLASGLNADAPPSTGNIASWWKTNGMLTSDNGREAPYNAIYSRITTQSNTYTVHWKVQALRKGNLNGASPAVWNEDTGAVTAELRGSTLIERYLDPNAGSSAAGTVAGNSIPDYANPSVGSTAYPITYYYKWRVDNESYFQPHP